MSTKIEATNDTTRQTLGIAVETQHLCQISIRKQDSLKTNIDAVDSKLDGAIGRMDRLQTEVITVKTDLRELKSQMQEVLATLGVLSDNILFHRGTQARSKRQAKSDD